MSENTRTFDAEVHIDYDDSNQTTSTAGHNLIINSDTIRLMQARNIAASTDSGSAGEFCFGSQTVLGVTTWYMYWHNGTVWRRSAFSDLPV